MSEFWITDSGVDFADGDVSDLNHEMIVVDALQRQIVDQCEKAFPSAYQDYSGKYVRYGDDEYVHWDEFKSALAEAYAEMLIQTRPVRQKDIERTLKRNPESYANKAMLQAGVKPIQISVANGQSDARDYAMEYWGWKTYRDGHIDTWNFRKSDLDAIVAGIESIANQDGWSDKKLARSTFVINVFSSGKSFHLSYTQMKQRNEKPKPTATTPQATNLINYGTSQAKQQVADIEKQSMNPYYAQKKFPFSDCTRFDMSFRQFLTG